ncbi:MULTISPECIES: DUF1294 domain-containing protein [Bacillaceae]|uniref:DUF1294 domain-containing protein n=1 Tax=Alteribacter populi TaxID=2011011 RepID=UPI000BBAC5FD
MKGGYVLEIAIINFFLWYYGIINVVGFFMMWSDKQKARKRKSRISEQALFTWASFGGAFGMLLSSRLFRHKTKKKTFKIGLPIFCLLHIVLSISLVIMMSHFLDT